MWPFLLRYLAYWEGGAVTKPTDFMSRMGQVVES
jgi:hypothetical protein